jgi:mRNA-degrading endonuclease RelE of RelBE toxin-antitoxin system
MEQICSICNKTYSNKKGLLKHRRNVHEVYCIEKDRKKDETSNCYKCKYCTKEYLYSQSRWQHEKKCKIQNEEKEKEEEEKRLKDDIELQTQILKNEMLQKELDDKNEIIRLQKKLLESKRIDNKTFKAVNRILMDRSHNNSINMTNSSNIINSNNNTYQILSLGNEELVNVLTMEQKKQILNSRMMSLEKIVEIAHCGEMNQFKNIIITNLKDNYAYRYDDSKGYFITVAKNDLLDDLVISRLTDIEAIYDELKSANKIDAKTKKLIQDFLDKMENNENPFFDNEMKYDNFRSYKIDKIRILLYNNQDKITKDISLLISKKEDPSDNLLENILHV